MKIFDIAPPSPVTHSFSQVIQSRFKRHLKHLAEAVLILFAVALTACGGGGGGGGGDGGGAGGTTSFNVSTSAGVGGTIDSGETVNSGATASFLVIPIVGFRYDTITGCGGTFAGNFLYQTAPITADCSISATFAPVENFTDVAPLYPDNGANWNDYVVGDANGASDSPCDAASLLPCLHGGERRIMTVTGLNSCAYLSASDNLRAFTWQCSLNDSGTAQFISTGLADGQHLSNLLDVTSAELRPNAVTVALNDASYGTTSSSTWWENPLVNMSSTASGPSLATSGTIYFSPFGSFENFTLDADKVSLVIMPGITLSGPDGGQDSYVIESINNDYLWIEGSIDAANDDIGIRLENVSYSVLRNVTSNNADDGIGNLDRNDNGVYLQSSDLNRLEDVTANGNTSNGIYLRNSHSNVLSRVTTDDNNTGVLISNSSSNNRLTDVNAVNNLDTGIRLTSNTIGSTLDVIKVSGSSTGILLDEGASNNTFSNVTASENQTNISLFQVSRNDFSTVEASDSTEAHGISLKGASTNTFSNVIAKDNASVGILLTLNVNDSGVDDYSDFNTFTTVTATGNDIGIELKDSSDNTFSGLDVTDNTTVNCKVTAPTGTEGGRVPGNAGLDNNCNQTTTAPPPAPKIVEFRIPAGTGPGPWNTQGTMVEANVGDIVRIFNDDSVAHAFHAPIVSGPVYQPCPHQDFSEQLAPGGEFYDCVTTGPIDPGAGTPVTYDHLFGPAASFWLRVLP